MKRLIAVLFLACLVVPSLAHAANDVPLISAQRLAVGAGVNREWTPNSQFDLIKQEWTAGIYGAYALTASTSESRIPRLSLVGSSVFGMDTKVSRWSLGLRVTLWDGGK